MATSTRLVWWAMTIYTQKTFVHPTKFYYALVVSEGGGGAQNTLPFPLLHHTIRGASYIGRPNEDQMALKSLIKIEEKNVLSF